MRENRIDVIWIPETMIGENTSEKEWAEDGFLYQKFKRDENGFLKGRSVVTNIGVFPYRMPDGTIRNELRLPEDVLNSDSLNSLKLMPFTNDHPPEGVTPETAKELQIGSLGEKLNFDQLYVSAPIMITDEDTIQAVEAGKRALSCGYSVEIEETAGTYLGMDYDVIQRNIRYNHVALVDAGRAGDAAIIKMDNKEDTAICNHDEQKLPESKKKDSKPKNKQTKNDKQEKPMHKVRLDNGLEYEASAEVALAYDKAVKKADTLETDLETVKQDAKDKESKLQAKLDTAEESLETAKADLKKEQDGFQAKLDAAISNRIALVDSAKALGVEIKEDSSDADIKKSVVLKAFPKADEKKLDEAVYLDARFDSACELLKADDKQTQDNLGKLQQHSDKSEKKDDEAESYTKMVSGLGFKAE